MGVNGNSVTIDLNDIEILREDIALEANPKNALAKEYLDRMGRLKRK